MLNTGMYSTDNFANPLIEPSGPKERQGSTRCISILEIASHHGHSDGQRLGRANPRPAGIWFIVV